MQLITCVNKRSQASLEYIILFGLFIGMLGFVSFYSSDEILSYIENQEVGDSVQTITHAIDQVGSMEPGTQKVIQVKLPKAVEQGYVSNKLVNFKFRDGKFFSTLSDIHYPSKVPAYGLLDVGTGVKYLSLEVEENGYVRVLPLRAHNLTDGLVAYFSMDYRNDTNVFESRGLVINGSMKDDTDCTVEGYIGTACSYDGSDDYLDIEDGDYLDFGTDDFSFSFWIKFNAAASGAGRIISKTATTGAGQAGWIMYHDSDGDLVFMMKDGVERHYTRDSSASFIDDGNWHFVVFVVDNRNSITEYVNGASVSFSTFEDDLSTIDSIDSNRNFTIGAEADGQTGFNGVIDELMVFNRTLSADDVELLYLLGRHPE